MTRERSRAERRFWKPDVSKDIEDELSVHLEMRQREYVERGVDPAEARDIAARRFGDVQSIAAACRDIDERWYREQRRASMWADLRQDVTYGLRVLRKSPGFVLAAVASLSIGIAATTAVFSVFNAFLLRSLPGVRDSARLAEVFTIAPWTNGGASLPESYEYYRQVLTSFSDIAGFSGTTVAITAADQPIVTNALLVTANYFRVLGTAPAAGTLLDTTSSRQAVAIAGHDFAVRHFGSPQAAAGRLLTINGQPFQIGGVTPPGFGGVAPGQIGGDSTSRPQLWLPYEMRAALEPPPDRRVNGGGRQMSMTEGLRIVGRLTPDATLAAARAQAAGVPVHTVRTLPGARPLVTSLGHGPRDTAADVAAAIALIFSVPLIVLAIGCANTANLQLARAAHRHGEIAVRRSLGATRGRIVRQLLIESLLVAGLAGAVGVAGTALLSKIFADAMPIPVPVDGRVLAFALITASLTGMAFGIAPARGATRGDLITPLKDSAGAPAFRRSRLRNGLVAAQIALSLALLVMAGLLTRTLHHLYGVDADREMSQIAAASVDLALLKYDPERHRAFQEELLGRIEQVPGVVAAAIAPFEPFGGSGGLTYQLPERTYSREHRYDHTNGGAALGHFFEAAGLRIVQGRGFRDADRTGEPKVALVTETLARRLSPSGGVIGRRLLVGDGSVPKTEVTIVGVTADARLRLTSQETHAMFLPSPLSYDAYFTLWVRAAGNPSDLLPHIRRVIGQMDPRLPIRRIGTADVWQSRDAHDMRLIATAVGSMGLIALALAGAGVYAVMSYLVAGRRHELAVRLALGATPKQLTSVVAGDGLRLSIPGVVLGTVLSVITAQLARAELLGLSPYDPIALAGVAALLVVVGLVATLIPALRASTLDPLVTLRRQ